MASIAWTDVLLVADELSVLSTNQQDLILEYVNTVIPADAWGGEDAIKLKLGRIYLAAHLGTLSASGAAGGLGQVLEIQEGDVRTRFAEAAKDGSSLEQTGYGQEYKRIARTTAARVMNGVP